jgi:hypothetical protein
MVRKLIIGLASAAAVTTYALTPALADVTYCMDRPNAETCPYAAGAVDDSLQHMKRMDSMNKQAHLLHGRYQSDRAAQDGPIAS